MEVLFPSGPCDSIEHWLPSNFKNSLSFMANEESHYYFRNITISLEKRYRKQLILFYDGIVARINACQLEPTDDALHIRFSEKTLL